MCGRIMCEVIEQDLKELKETWDFTEEQIQDIRERMAIYAFRVDMCPELMREVYYILEKINTQFDKGLWP